MNSRHHNYNTTILKLQITILDINKNLHNSWSARIKNIANRMIMMPFRLYLMTGITKKQRETKWYQAIISYNIEFFKLLFNNHIMFRNYTRSLYCGGLCVTKTTVEGNILKTQTEEMSKVILMPRRHLIWLALQKSLIIPHKFVGVRNKFPKDHIWNFTQLAIFTNILVANILFI